MEGVKSGLEVDWEGHWRGGREFIKWRNSGEPLGWIMSGKGVEIEYQD